MSNLAVATTGGTTLDTKGRTLAGLADASHHLLAHLGAQGLRQSHGGGGLALTQGRGRDAAHHHYKHTNRKGTHNALRGRVITFILKPSLARYRARRLVFVI